MKQKHLLLILIILLVVYLGFELLDSSEKNYSEDFGTFDSSLIDKFILIPKNNAGIKLIFKKDGDSWSLESEGKTYQTEDEFVNHVISELSKLKSIRVAANKESQWKKFGVTDSLGTKVQLFDGDEEIFAVIFGKFSPVANNNSLGSMQGINGISMIRVREKETVYAVGGFLSLSLNRSLKDFRNQILFDFDPKEVEKISFNLESEQYSILKSDLLWLLSGNEISPDSVELFLGGLSKINSSDFQDDFIPSELGSDYSVIFSSSDGKEIIISVYKTADQDTWIIKSSINNSYFKVNQNVFEKIFKDKSFFINHKKANPN